MTMQFAVRTSDGRWTGVVYDAVNDAIRAHHAQYAEVLVPVTALRQVGDEAQPVWEADEASLAAHRAAAMAVMGSWIATFLGHFTDGLPLAEVASWPTKAEAATRHLAGDPQPMIEAEAAITGEDPEALAHAIVARAAQYTGLIARVTGLRRQTSAALEAATSPEAVREVLIAAQETALTLAAQMGMPELKDMSNA